MEKFDRTGERLAALAVLGLLLFNFPLLALFNRGGTLFGIPLLYLYIFAAWAGLVTLMAWVAERRR